MQCMVPECGSPVEATEGAYIVVHMMILQI